MIDIHSHILPGIDDGAVSMSDSVAMVRELSEQGVTDIVATPHYVDETNYTSPSSYNRELVEELRDALKSAEVSVNIYLGNEIYITESIVDLLKAKKICTMADSKYLLVELPLNEKFPNYDDIIMELLQKDYKVLLAHPERYAMVQEDYNTLSELVGMGVLLQCNIGSLLGQYGKAAKKTIKKMADDKMIFAFGTDLHHCRGGDYIMTARKKLAKFYNERELEQIFTQNAKKILSE